MTDTAPNQLTNVEEFNFRQIVGHFASGVTVVTTVEGDHLFGTTASAFSSLSLDPPSVLVCLNRASITGAAVARRRLFGINILAADQQEYARHFAGSGGDKFAGVPFTRSEHGGVPLLDGSLATMVCEVMDAPVGGTHTVFFGRVIEATEYQREPLAYYQGRFGRFSEHLDFEI